MNKTRLAFLGAGDVAQRDYLPELHRLDDRVVRVAICAQTPDRARAMAATYHFKRWYAHGDYARMLAENDIDAVANLTPIQLHYETNLGLLQAGKHVYSEKPLAGTVAETRRLQQTSRARGLVLVSAPCVMLWPQVLFAQRLLQQGEIGEVYSARAYGHGGVPPWSGYTSDPSPFFARGGGPAMDMGVYPLHALTGLLGPVKRVTAMIGRTQSGFVVADGPAAGKPVPMEVDDHWQMLLDFGSSRIAYAAANNCVQDTRAPQLELHGLKGTVALNLIDVSAPVEIFRAGQGWETVRLPQSGRASGPDHLLGIAHLVDCIQTGSEPILNARHAIHVLDILETAARASAEGRTLAVESSIQAA
jgi:predicted dehydrogenase